MKRSKIFGISDRVRHQAGRDGYKGLGGMPEDGHRRGHVLQLEKEVRGPGGLRAAQAQGPGGGEFTAQEAGGRP